MNATLTKDPELIIYANESQLLCPNVAYGISNKTIPFPIVYVNDEE
jgi:hypothetical protein